MCLKWWSWGEEASSKGRFQLFRLICSILLISSSGPNSTGSYVTSNWFSPFIGPNLWHIRFSKSNDYKLKLELKLDTRSKKTRKTQSYIIFDKYKGPHLFVVPWPTTLTSSSLIHGWLHYFVLLAWAIFIVLLTPPPMKCIWSIWWCQEERKEKNLIQCWLVWHECEFVGPILLKNPLGMGLGLLPTLQ